MYPLLGISDENFQDKKELFLFQIILLEKD